MNSHLQTVLASSNRQIDHLLEIICVKLQLTATQFESAESRYAAIGDWLLADGSAVAKYRPQVYPQGSLSLGTTVKPWGGNEFDLDLVCELQVSEQSHPGEVFQLVWNRMASHQTYVGKLKRLNRCIRVEYANDFHLDIVPAIPDESQNGGHILVPDLNAKLRLDHPENNTWKPSNPRGYREWFVEPG